LLRSSSPKTIDGAGDILTKFLRAYPRGEGEVDIGQYEREQQVFAASGAASLWRLETVRKLGLFDSDLFFSYEDVDLSFRARLAGYECWYAPRAVALHVRGGTSLGRPEFRYFHALRNRWCVIVKDVPTQLLVQNLHRVAFAEVLTIGRSLNERQL